MSRITRLIFACIASIGAFFSLLLETIITAADYPAYTPTPTESLALDRARNEAEATPLSLERLRAFAARALSHARFTAGHFATPGGTAPS